MKLTLGINLVDDWKQIVKKAGSMRWAAVAGLCGGLEAILPLFQDAIPRGRFAICTVLAAVAAMVSRVAVQPEMHDA